MLVEPRLVVVLVESRLVVILVEFAARLEVRPARVQGRVALFRPLEDEAAVALSSKLEPKPFCASARDATSASIVNRTVATISLIGLIEFYLPLVTFFIRDDRLRSRCANWRFETTAQPADQDRSSGLGKPSPASLSRVLQIARNAVTCALCYCSNFKIARRVSSRQPRMESPRG